MKAEEDNSLTRRAMLQRGVIGGGALLATPLLAACGSRSATTTSAARTSTASGGATAKAGMAVNSISDLKPFTPSSSVGAKPSLPKRIAWASSSNAQFFNELGASIERAAHDRGLAYVTAIANNDASTGISQMNNFMQVGIAALCLQPIDAASQAIVMKQAIGKGIAVMSLVTPPSTVQAVADQYQVGHAQGLAAAKWIKQNLGGKAQVVNFNLDSVQVLIARHKGVLAGVKSAGPGVKIVADVEPNGETIQDAQTAMNTILQAHPDVDVVLGSAGDTYAMGALAAIRATGKDTSKMYLSGINGDDDALAEIAKGGPYKASFAFAYNLMGYAWGQFAADWLAGKQVPQLMVFNPVKLDSKATIDQFQHAMSPSVVSRTYQQSSTYMRLLGSINYESRTKYLTTSPS